MLSTLEYLIPTSFPALKRAPLETLQVNLGYVCNQQCLHCHVNAGPKRTEIMTSETVTDVIDFLRASRVQTLDLTGGAPELNPEFRSLVEQARSLGVHVIDRCNLTILEEPGQEDLAGFLAANRVEIVASLPCYLEENVDRQRGKGVFAGSIRALHTLNSFGYGLPDTGLVLNLVYNPQGPRLPPPQEKLESDYRGYLAGHYGIVFSHLYTLANMPILRFGSTLLSKGQFDDYMDVLRQAHSECNLAQVMCRSLVSVDWQGYLYDCDFNQMLGLSITDVNGERRQISRVKASDFEGQSIRIGEHCYGCTAGQGSGCGGAL